MSRHHSRSSFALSQRTDETKANTIDSRQERLLRHIERHEELLQMPVATLSGAGYEVYSGPPGVEVLLKERGHQLRGFIDILAFKGDEARVEEIKSTDGPSFGKQQAQIYVDLLRRGCVVHHQLKERLKQCSVVGFYFWDNQDTPQIAPPLSFQDRSSWATWIDKVLATEKPRARVTPKENCYGCKASRASCYAGVRAWRLL